VLRETIALVGGDVVVKEKVFHIYNGKFVQSRKMINTDGYNDLD